MKPVQLYLSKLIAIVLVASVPLQAVAECDFTTGIEKMADGRYAYSASCHRAVGKLVQDGKDKDDQIAALNKTVELKDLGIRTHEQRAQLWMDTSMKLEDRVNQMDTMKSTNQWLFFGIGVLTTGAAVWAASQLRR